MLRIRMIEMAISNRYSDQEMRCPVHLSIGQEAIAVGICDSLRKNDKIVTAHRSHAHYLAKGGSLKKMLAELHGKVTGCAKGFGGSMHLVDLKAGVYAAVPIVGSALPIGTGIAWANKLKKKKDIVVAFFGDAATEEGVFFESLDFASLHNLPILFVCENNDYSIYSHISKRQSKKRNISKIAKSLGIKSAKLNGNSIEEVFNITNKIVKEIKKNSKPYLIELKTFRNIEHCGPNNDDFLNYRSKTYLNFWKNKCPVINYENELKKKKYLSTLNERNIKKKISKEINRSFNFARSSKFPDKNLLKKYIYA
tara:strand:- start:28808 stop:29737 length:930 start_codon:yes stop_codon:yes gene_type:complete